MCIGWRNTFLFMGQDTYDAVSRRSFSAKEPLIIRLFCGKWPIKIRHPMHLRHPVHTFLLHFPVACTYTHVTFSRMRATSHLEMCDPKKKKPCARNTDSYMPVYIHLYWIGVSCLHSRISIDNRVLYVSFTMFRWKETEEIEIGDWN